MQYSIWILNKAGDWESAFNRADIDPMHELMQLVDYPRVCVQHLNIASITIPFQITFHRARYADIIPRL